MSMTPLGTYHMLGHVTPCVQIGATFSYLVSFCSHTGPLRTDPLGASPPGAGGSQFPIVRELNDSSTE